MQKKLSLLLLFLFMFILNFPSLNAEDEDINRNSVTCKYEVPVFGASGIKGNPIITLEFKVKGKETGIFMNGKRVPYLDTINNSGFPVPKEVKSGNYYITLSNLMLLNLLKMEENYTLSNGKLVCPDLAFTKSEMKVTNKFRFEGTEIGSPAYIVKLFTGDTTNALKLYQLDSFGDIIHGDDDNDNEKKVCKVVMKGSDIDIDNFDASQLEIHSYEDGSYYISLNNAGAYVETSAKAWNGVRYVWKVKVLNSTFLIRESEWEEIKNAFPYNTSDECTKTIRVAKSKTLPKYYILSINSISDIGFEDGNLIDGSYDPNEDGNVNPDPISGSSGTCASYLGVAGEGDNIATFLDRIYTLIKVGSIVIVIIMSSLEFANSITKNKDDLMDVVKRFVKRLIIMIIILMLPTFIDLFGSLFGIDNILCGIK